MKLFECNVGRIVKRKKAHELVEGTNIGHIVGLTANPMGEIIPLVLFACEKEPTGIHHELLEVLTD
jgi:hypothetical protein